jgi:hypothetical protein
LRIFRWLVGLVGGHRPWRHDLYQQHAVFRAEYCLIGKRGVMHHDVGAAMSSGSTSCSRVLKPSGRSIQSGKAVIGPSLSRLPRLTAGVNRCTLAASAAPAADSPQLQRVQAREFAQASATGHPNPHRPEYPSQSVTNSRGRQARYAPFCFLLGSCERTVVCVPTRLIWAVCRRRSVDGVMPGRGGGGRGIPC